MKRHLLQGLPQGGVAGEHCVMLDLPVYVSNNKAKAIVKDQLGDMRA